MKVDRGETHAKRNPNILQIVIVKLSKVIVILFLRLLVCDNYLMSPNVTSIFYSRHDETGGRLGKIQLHTDDYGNYIEPAKMQVFYFKDRP